MQTTISIKSYKQVGYNGKIIQSQGGNHYRQQLDMPIRPQYFYLTLF